ncbi:protein-L-isoaspartate O-methyltransferase family protein [Qipengyuania intermedia]|uniref:protein-L-isoaspartate O-methyltransferase family protein n=1 Tax=Qipengyuania intermedia TaxID=2867244 RepID=UPI001FFC6F03|nr:protein-L-isoaspartate O-methyltransferase [Qipengyuania intermedia]
MNTTTTTRPEYSVARKAMIDSQLRTSGVNEAFVLERMSTVPREDFVPENAKGTAYMDRAIRLADGGFLPAPLFHGAMLAEARPSSEDRVLVIDGGSGYLPALVEPLVASVEVLSADKAAATKKKGDYTLVLIDGAVEHIPANVAKLVAEEGRIVTGLVERGVTRLATGRKSGKALALLPLAEMGVPRLGAFDKPESWSF